MTEKERYEVLLGGLAELLKQKNSEIFLMKFEIDNLKTKLAEAEFHLNPVEAKRPKSLEIRGG